MRALLVVAAVAGIAEAKPKPLAATLACAAIDDAAQRRKLDDKQRTARPKTTHAVECAVSSIDGRLSDSSIKTAGRTNHGKDQHEVVEGKLVGDSVIKGQTKRLFMIEFDAERWDRCEDVDLELSIHDGDGVALWQHTIKTAGSCAKK
jgi:hypothetical protein